MNTEQQAKAYLISQKSVSFDSLSSLLEDDFWFHIKTFKALEVVELMHRLKNLINSVVFILIFSYQDRDDMRR